MVVGEGRQRHALLLLDGRGRSVEVIVSCAAGGGRVAAAAVVAATVVLEAWRERQMGRFNK